MARYSRPAAAQIDTLTFFAAALAADRINGGQYIKPDTVQTAEPILGTNRSLTQQALADASMVTEADRERASLMRTHFQGLMMQIVAGKMLSEFDAKCLALANGDTISERDLGWVACLPSTWSRAQKRAADRDRLLDAKPEHLGKIGERVQVQAEVLACRWSQNWAVFYVTALTPDNQALFWASRENLDQGSRWAIQGKVKAHRDQFQTQLSHVKILGRVDAQ